jgi:hypothetical protein
MCLLLPLRARGGGRGGMAGSTAVPQGCGRCGRHRQPRFGQPCNHTGREGVERRWRESEVRGYLPVHVCLAAAGETAQGAAARSSSVRRALSPRVLPSSSPVCVAMAAPRPVCVAMAAPRDLGSHAWKSVRGRSTQWTEADVHRLADAWHGSIPVRVAQLLETPGWKGGAVVHFKSTGRITVDAVLSFHGVSQPSHAVRARVRAVGFGALSWACGTGGREGGEASLAPTLC